jgi:hypothetical protein
MPFLWELWEIFINAVETLVFVLFLTKQLDYKKANKRKVWVGFVLLIVFLTTLNFMQPHVIVVTLLMLLADIAYTFFTFRSDNNKGKYIFWGCTRSVIAFFSNGIVATVAAKNINFSALDVFTQNSLRFEMMCLYILIYILLFMVLYHVTKNKKEIDIPPQIQGVLLIVLVFAIIVACLISQVTIYATGDNQIVFLTSIITGALFFIIICTMLLFEYLGLLYKQHLDLQLDLQQQKIETERCQNIKETYQEIREWKHDYRNHLIVIHEYAKRKKLDELCTYIGELEQDISNIHYFANTGNPTLDAIIYNKMLIAKSHSIPFNTEIAPSEQLTISDVALCSIMGNLLDNAIEASVRLDKALWSNRFIDLTITPQKQMLLIQVINYYDGVSIHHKGKLQTRKKNAQNHGIGLNRVKKLLYQENGYCNINPGDHIFSVEVLLPQKEEAYEYSNCRR